MTCFRELCVFILVFRSVILTCVDLGFEKLSVRQNPENISATEGGKVTLNCFYSISNFSVIEFIWSYIPPGDNRLNCTRQLVINRLNSSNEQISKKHNNRYISSWDISNNRTSLVITTLELNDTGHYYCTVSLFAPTMMQDRGNGTWLTVLGKPPKVWNYLFGTITGLLLFALLMLGFCWCTRDFQVFLLCCLAQISPKPKELCLLNLSDLQK
ncbi:uncharacterized protein LOC122800284 [Protopterus annectens]|uniref:uncharacterized protein LOC122800284 n=1 Tax=Protopterus annectens TaxID=7888 RepID=UPI001CFA6CC8|nr:uncharacterized protein LOC122800284 [Protopterus annectens]